MSGSIVYYISLSLYFLCFLLTWFYLPWYYIIWFDYCGVYFISITSYYWSRWVGLPDNMFGRPLPLTHTLNDLVILFYPSTHPSIYSVFISIFNFISRIKTSRQKHNNYNCCLHCPKTRLFVHQHRLFDAENIVTIFLHNLYFGVGEKLYLFQFILFRSIFICAFILQQNLFIFDD